MGDDPVPRLVPARVQPDRAGGVEVEARRQEGRQVQRDRGNAAGSDGADVHGNLLIG